MSTVKYYRDLLAEPQRIEAFRRAIAHVVGPGDRVLDVGTGLGTFAFFAADAGAEVVWAVEGKPVVHVAKAVGRLNGYDGRVAFIRGWLPEVTLPERADVIIFEDFPPRLLDARAFNLLRTLREQYAAAAARFVPAQAEVFVAPISSSDLARAVASFATGEACYGVDWSPSREYVVNSPLNTAIPAAAVAGCSVHLGHVRFSDPPSAGPLGGRASWSFDAARVVHGLAYWFDLDLGGGARLSNAPGAEPGSWGQLFLPVDPPLQVPPGGKLGAAVRVDTLRGGAPGWLAWELVAGDARRRGHEFRAAPAALVDLAQASPDYVPQLDRRGRLDALVLGLTDGTRSVRQIAQVISAEGEGLAQPDAERLVARTLHDRIRAGDGSRIARAGGES